MKLPGSFNKWLLDGSGGKKTMFFLLSYRARICCTRRLLRFSVISLFTFYKKGLCFLPAVYTETPAQYYELIGTNGSPQLKWKPIKPLKILSS